ncbi:unnamed protein product [Closterium sp. Naga37s-1]|nr:unnamed protein product [Closterium sp. Naga37s-1]
MTRSALLPIFLALLFPSPAQFPPLPLWRAPCCMPNHCLLLCSCGDPIPPPFTSPLHPSLLLSAPIASLASNVPVPILPLAFRISGQATVPRPLTSHRTAVSSPIGRARPASPPSLMALTYSWASASRLPASRHNAGMDLANASRLPASCHDADADLANASRLHASRHDADADLANVSRLPASWHDADADLASASRLPTSRHDAGVDLANPSRLPASLHDADADPANAIRLPASRHSANADRVSVPRRCASHLGSDADLATAVRLCSSLRHAPDVRTHAILYAAGFAHRLFHPPPPCLTMPSRLPA